MVLSQLELRVPRLSRAFPWREDADRLGGDSAYQLATLGDCAFVMQPAVRAVKPAQRVREILTRCAKPSRCVAACSTFMSLASRQRLTGVASGASAVSGGGSR